MSDADQPDPHAAPESAGDAATESAPESAWERRRRLARIFGDILPETTSDERDEPAEKRNGDTWLRDQVPPHHGKL